MSETHWCLTCKEPIRELHEFGCCLGCSLEKTLHHAKQNPVQKIETHVCQQCKEQIDSAFMYQNGTCLQCAIAHARGWAFQTCQRCKNSKSEQAFRLDRNFEKVLQVVPRRPICMHCETVTANLKRMEQRNMTSEEKVLHVQMDDWDESQDHLAVCQRCGQSVPQSVLQNNECFQCITTSIPDTVLCDTCHKQKPRTMFVKAQTQCKSCVAKGRQSERFQAYFQMVLKEADGRVQDILTCAKCKRKELICYLSDSNGLCRHCQGRAGHPLYKTFKNL